MNNIIAQTIMTRCLTRRVLPFFYNSLATVVFIPTSARSLGDGGGMRAGVKYHLWQGVEGVGEALENHVGEETA